MIACDSTAEFLTRSVADVLQREGCAAQIHPADRWISTQPWESDVILEGEIHEFWIETDVCTALYADFTLKVSSHDEKHLIWSADFPDNPLLPVWMSLVRSATDLLREAIDDISVNLARLSQRHSFHA